MTRTHAEKTSAADKSIGFDFQYYYFLSIILNLKPGQSAGLEVRDDVHADLGANYQILVQLKHTVQTRADSTPTSLTELDADFWKSLSNWAKTVTDAHDGRATVVEQMRFLGRTQFQLVSNKGASDRNNFVGLLEGLSDERHDLAHVDAEIERLRMKTVDASIKSYISDVQALDQTVRREFLKRIKVRLELHDVHNEIRSAIRQKLFASNERIQEVFERLDSRIRTDNFISIRKGKPIVIAFEDFEGKYRKIFEDARSRRLPRYSFVPAIPANPLDQIFLKELLEIGDVAATDMETIISYTEQKLMLANLLEAWVEKGDLVSDDVKELHDDTKQKWSNAFRRHYRGGDSWSDEEVKTVALRLLDELRCLELVLAAEGLNSKLSNGELYGLADRVEIGWRRDWNKGR